MSNEKLSRRQFLSAAAMTAAGAALVACQPQTVIVKETVQVEKEVEKVVKETVVVEKEVEVEKEVTKVVEKVVEVTVAPEDVKESPALFAQVSEGKLPPVAERVGQEPVVVAVTDEVGVYGGTWRRVAIQAGDPGIITSRLSYVGPVRYTEMASDIVPFLSKGFEASADGSEFTFHMRKGALWSDGQPYTADDVMFYYEDIRLNTEMNPNGIGGWLKVGGEPVVIEKVDDFTFKFKFVTPYGLFIPILASPDGQGTFNNWPKHYATAFHASYAKKEDLDKLMADAGADNWVNLFNQKDDWNGDLTCPRMWPWPMTRVPPEIPAIAERNPYYFAVDPEGNQLPYIDRIRFEVVENIDLLNTKTLAGAVDMQFRHISWVNYALYVEGAAVGQYEVYEWMLAEGSNYCLHFNLNHENPGLRELEENINFRHALSIAIDREEIRDVAYSGLGTPRQASVLPTVKGYKPEQSTAWAQFDPELANQMLDEIGLTAKDAEGFRLNLKGEPLSINIEYVALFGPWGDITQMICQYWKDIGIRAFPKEMARTLFGERGTLGTVQDMSVWTMDRSAHPLVQPLYQMPLRGGTPASVGALYQDWRDSDGANGEEPPPEVQKAYDLYESCKTAKNDAELLDYATQLLDLNAEQTWFIGVVGLLPHVGIVKNNFHNVPKEAVSDWLCLTPGNTYIEQYYMSEG
ncbi:MAG: ABC transporter substrate-binding protein [Anaerolineae bacterium]|nr:ABC transporter substrate-binding protein [Anaerolineae bacterium]